MLLPNDTDTIHSVLAQAGREACTTFQLRLASAYLNPTPSLLRATLGMHVHCLSAGFLSHGFKPKKVTGNRSRTDWVPQVFDHIALLLPSHATVWHYNREGWTFHAKGLWLTFGATESDNLKTPLIGKSEKLVLATHGSGNYGWRSEMRDMESNLILVFPTDNDWSGEHIDEWNEMVSTHVSRPQQSKGLPWYLSMAVPSIKSFF